MIRIKDKERLEKWKTRLNKERVKKRWSQEQFAKEINKKHASSFRQSRIAVWENLNDKHYPKYESMIQIAETFGVDVGYLTGETDYSTFSTEEIATQLNIKETAINGIKKISTWHNHIKDEEAEILSEILASDKFRDIIDTLAEVKLLHKCQDKYLKLSPINNYPKEQVKIAVEYYHKYYGITEDTMKCLSIEERGIIDNIPGDVKEMMILISKAFDSGYNFELSFDDILNSRIFKIQKEFIEMAKSIINPSKNK